MKCVYCKGKCIKVGKQSNGTQKYQCKACQKYQQEEYKYLAYAKDVNKRIIRCIQNSVGIRGVSRVVKIAVNTVIKRIRYIASKIKPPIILASSQTYEVDEVWTYVRSKTHPCWIMYAINRLTREPVALQVGNRNTINLRKLIERLLVNNPKKIYTDKLNIYTKIIPKSIHGKTQYGTNHIERKNLTLRTHLKPLNRKTICYSKNRQMLINCLLIFFWGKG